MVGTGFSEALISVYSLLCEVELFVFGVLVVVEFADTSMIVRQRKIPLSWWTRRLVWDDVSDAFGWKLLVDAHNVNFSVRRVCHLGKSSLRSFSPWEPVCKWSSKCLLIGPMWNDRDSLWNIPVHFAVSGPPNGVLKNARASV